MIKLTWKPVLQALALKEYHPDYGDEKIMVLVNPTPEFMGEYVALRNEYAVRSVEVQRLMLSAETASDADKPAAKEQAVQKDQEYTAWVNDIFLPGMDDWYARLWSFGSDKYTVADLAEFNKVDPHFVTWAKASSVEMIDVHRTARKKA